MRRARFQVLTRRWRIPWSGFGQGLAAIFAAGAIACALWKLLQVQVILVPVEKGSELWTQLPALSTLVVGLGGLATFVVNKRQKDAHFEFESLQREFKDILDRIAGESTPLRAHAASRLADMATRSLLTTPGGKRQPYPFFAQASAQLTSALHLENEPAVRAEIVKALRRLVEWCGEDQQRLLVSLIQDLADANRSARRAVATALAELCADRKVSAARYIHDEAVREVLSLLASTSPLQLPAECASQCVEELTRSSECAAQAQQLHSRFRLTQPESCPDLTTVYSALVVLDDTRHALALALGAFANQHLTRESRKRRLDLSGCFLPALQAYGLELEGADLRDCMLQDATLANACLAHADLSRAWMARAYLPGSDLSKATMKGARLPGATLSRARLRFVDGREADLREAWLNDADIHEACLEGACLDGARLSLADARGAMLMGASLRDAHLDDVKLRSAQLTSATLSGACLSGADLTTASILGTDFENADLSAACFDGARRWGCPPNSFRDGIHPLTRFAGADVTEASFAGADLTLADLRLAKGLTRGQIDSARTDATTQLPAL